MTDGTYHPPDNRREDVDVQLKDHGPRRHDAADVQYDYEITGLMEREARSYARPVAHETSTQMTSATRGPTSRTQPVGNEADGWQYRTPRVHAGAVVYDVAADLDLSRAADSHVARAGTAADGWEPFTRPRSHTAPIWTAAVQGEYRTAESHVRAVETEAERDMSSMSREWRSLTPGVASDANGWHWRDPASYVGAILADADTDMSTAVRGPTSHVGAVISAAAFGWKARSHVGTILSAGQSFLPHRMPRSFSSPVVSDTYRENNVDRTNVVSYVAGIFSHADGLYWRDPTSFVAAVHQDGVRASMYMERYPETPVMPVIADSTRTNDVSRTNRNHTGPVVSDADAWKPWRDPTNHTGPVLHRSERYPIGAWMVGGDMIREAESEERDHTTLKLGFRSPEHIFKERVEPLDSNVGAVDITTMSDGSFRAFDRSGGGNRYRVDPPLDRGDPREPGWYMVDKVDGEVVNEQADVYRATLELVSEASREPEGRAPSEGRSEGEWLFEFSHGAVATSRVEADIKTESDSGSRSRTAKLMLTGLQALAVEVSATYVDAVAVNEIPDGPNYAEDNSPGGRNVVDVTAPEGGGDVLPGGTYAVEGWDTDWVNNEFVEMELELVHL